MEKTTMKDVIIKVEHLSKTFRVAKQKGVKGLFKKTEYEEVSALRDINFEVKKGEFVALLGPNGAGKSTLIKTLIGVLAYDAGSLSVMGFEPLNERRKIIGSLGIVFGQRSRLWYDLPVRESFELTKRLYITDYPSSKTEVTKQWEKFLIDSIEIGHLLNRQVKKLSLGEKMRCELVNTLLYNPDLIFLDEPTIGLDVVSKQKIREALQILHEQGKTIVLTSHDTGDIEKLCERVIVINHGSVVVDLGMQDFMKLNDESQIVIKVNRKLPKNYATAFTGHLIQLNRISDYEFQVICKKAEFKNIVKLAFDSFDVADLTIAPEGEEKILIDLYKNDK